MTEIFRRNIQVDNVTDALTAIQAALADAGWSTITGTPTSLPLVMGSETIVNGVRVYHRFTSPSANVLRLNGDRLGDGTSLSPNRDWTLSTGSRLWLATDGDGSVFYIKPASGNGFAYHSGRLDLANPDDGFGWQVGILTGSQGAQAHTANNFNTTTFWVGSLQYGGCYTNLFTTDLNYDSNADALNIVTGKPEIGPYWRVSQKGAFRGAVKFAVIGLAGLIAGIEYEAQNGSIYVATGTGGFRVS